MGSSSQEISRQEGEEKETFLEPFEPGNPWTQKLSTQVHRQVWRKEVYMTEENVIGDMADDRQLADQVVKETRQQRDRDGEEQSASKPWWSEGKTAPLLNDFDSTRRSFYLTQAGLNTLSSDGNQIYHSHQGRQAVTEASSSSPLKVTPRRALTLAGNANLSTGTNFNTPMAVTPRKKTWDATWGQDGQRSVNSSNKKPINEGFTPSRTARGSTTLQRGRKARRTE